MQQPNFFDDDDTASTNSKSTAAFRKSVKGRKSVGLYPHNRARTHDAAGSMFPNLAKRATQNVNKPRPNARADRAKVPGSRSAPWLRLTAAELEDLEVRQRQELAKKHIIKSFDWKPNTQSQEAELERLGRGRVAMTAAAKLAQETGADFLDEEAVMRAESTDNEAPDENQWQDDDFDGGSDIVMGDAGDIGRMAHGSISSSEDNNDSGKKTKREGATQEGESTLDGSKKTGSSSGKENQAPRRDLGRLKKNEIPQIVWQVGRHGRGHAQGEVMGRKGRKKYSDKNS